MSKQKIDFINLPLDILRKIMIDELYPGDIISLNSVNKYFKDVVCNPQFWSLYMKEKFKVSVGNTFSKIDLIRLIKEYRFLGSMNIQPTHNDLIKAIKTDDTLIIELLLNDSRIDPTFDDNEAIRFASEYGRTFIVELLLNWKGSLDSKCLKTKRVDPATRNNHALIWATIHGHTSVVELLLKDARVDPTDQNNLAVYFASEDQHISVIKLLLEWRGPPDSEGRSSSVDYKQAMMKAYHYGNYKVTKLFENYSRGYISKDI